ncbi:uncharacterized protein LY89DRAFT_787638 [Mollisia scopiformis]|uniref:Uncharacterized protein n=1 Tax=Mollisia scopiformis TaxID=149040 RepID=A0A132BC10_MOLSC|nr:uncharacterized protein LY89DRAFT_787638 [Mollisia scopiformis]KUJ09945.1 hypothetical protein LY89DRAFT_787638 [Mollisia scopiformis]
MRVSILSSILLSALHITATPVRRDVDSEAATTTIVTVTATLYATLVPPTLPVVYTSATYTQAVYTSTSTLSSILNCTQTLYSPIIAPVNGTTMVAPASAATIAPAGLDIPEGLQGRQVPTSPSLTPTSTTSASVTRATSTTEAAITASVFTTVTATYSLTQRPPYTYTIYSVQTATQTVPLIRTAYACSATLDVFYSIVTDVVTSTIIRTHWPSTTTTTSYTACAALPTVATTPSASVSKPVTVLERQVGGTTAVFSTTATQTRYAYSVTTITEAGPSTRVVTACSPTATPSAASTATV